MASEIRVNSINNRSGLGTITVADTGIVVSGLITATTFSGNITGVAATFTGNVSIAGTLTYEDVTNIDSVGLITARSGVVLTGGNVTLGTGVTASGSTSNTFTLSTNGSERLRVDSSGNINADSGGVYYDATNNRLAIGTTDPQTALDVRGEASIAYNATYGLRFYNQDRNNWSSIGNNIATGGTSANLVFKDSTGEVARMTGGRLLVGTSSARTNFYNSVATSQFQVEGTSFENASASFTCNNSDGTQTSVLVFGKSNGTGVGSNTLVTNNTYLGAVSFMGNDGTEFVKGAEIRAEVDGTPGANDMPGRLTFSTTADGASSPTERMRIDNTGGILFGRTVLGNIGDSLGIAFGGGAGYAYFERSGGPGIYVRRATSTGNAVEFYQGTNTYVGSISVTASATAYNTSSDYRLKENVKLVTDGINRLQQLKPSRFNFIADPDTVVDGFIAHEVQAVVPEAITGEKDAVDEDGNPVYQGIDQSKLVPLLTAALQEAVAKIESLEARLTAAGI